METAAGWLAGWLARSLDQRLLNPSPSNFKQTGIEYFASTTDLINDGRVAVVAPNPDTVAKAQVFRHGLIEAWRDPQRVSFAMFSRAPVVDGSRLHHEAELLGSVNGADVIIVDDIIDTANTLVRAAEVCKVRKKHDAYDATRGPWLCV